MQQQYYYVGKNTHKEINMNNRIYHEVNKQRIIKEEKDDCTNYFFYENPKHMTVQNILKIIYIKTDLPL